MLAYLNHRALHAENLVARPPPRPQRACSRLLCPIRHAPIPTHTDNARAYICAQVRRWRPIDVDMEFRGFVSSWARFTDTAGLGSQTQTQTQTRRGVLWHGPGFCWADDSRPLAALSAKSGSGTTQARLWHDLEDSVKGLAAAGVRRHAERDQPVQPQLLLPAPVPGWARCTRPNTHACRPFSAPVFEGT